MSIDEKYYPLIILAVCVLLFFPHLDVLYANIMEARNFITAREMLHYDNWVFTTMNGEARYEKPPLPTWLAAFSGAIFGISKLWALRLPSAIITTVMALFSFWLSRKRLSLSAKQSLYTALILATSFYVIFAGRNGTWDIFAHSFMLGGIYFLFQFFTESKQKYRNASLAGLFIGLSFMSKGPVSHFALLSPFLIAYAWVYKFRSFKSRIAPFMGLLVIALALSSWWALAIYFGDGETAQAIADKESAAWANHNTRPFYYYWSFFTQSGIWTVPAFVALLYPYLKSRVTHLKAYRFSLIWTLAAVVLLSCIPEKKSRYLLPVLIPLALNTSFYIEYLVRSFKNLSDKRETIPVYFYFGLIAVICVLAGPALLYLFINNFRSTDWLWYGLFQLAAIAFAFVIIKSLRSKIIEPAFFVVIGFSCAIILFVFPLVRLTYTNQDFREIAPIISDYEAAGKPIYLLENSSPELIWDFGQRVPTLISRDSKELPDAEFFYVIIEQDRIDRLKEELPEYKLEQIDCYDGNITSKADRNYKTRRIGCIYKAQLKD
ncbi:4-amino-4-deoxy-L-arabinose transferase-like glycosyltransferase [Leeuwenhoekiella aestuarii]|uniref:4-amino-4-deoxy-L-arabinose transferase-like glycosyltransferase n=1 Tax=Leeuwenhoekiella aestuarii TaxID=2249426 RepID=A0A4Q0NNS0_9FLAO|nr:glycosyltransferase family 39 protein [Leeuwenhoekiella aestuarii]RXG11719.1 4-amino-4-deoxy-L-arabinose transferase-like glycosyltransferase [Leeuwenhoekiella aestuarii]RXG12774.1 4-amino-4-deoxy-L-arabinose transferase-like glycosyltransferase [Leeuwenhoekiella aestuarii]